MSGVENEELNLLALLPFTHTHPGSRVPSQWGHALCPRRKQTVKSNKTKGGSPLFRAPHPWGMSRWPPFLSHPQAAGVESSHSGLFIVKSGDADSSPALPLTCEASPCFVLFSFSGKGGLG